MEQTQQVIQTALTVIDQAKQVVIITAEDYTRAGELWTVIRGIIKQADEAFDPIIKKAHDAHKEAVAQKKKIYDPLDGAMRSIKSLMSKYDDEQREIARKEQARLAEIARKEAEERKLQEALEAEMSGDKDEAEAIIEAPVQVATVTVEKATPKVAGVVFSERWSAECVDIKALCRAVADGTQSTELVTPNLVALNRLAVALKATMAVPGCKAVSRRV